MIFILLDSLTTTKTRTRMQTDEKHDSPPWKNTNATCHVRTYLQVHDQVQRSLFTSVFDLLLALGHKYNPSRRVREDRFRFPTGSGIPGGLCKRVSDAFILLLILPCRSHHEGLLSRSIYIRISLIDGNGVCSSRRRQRSGEPISNALIGAV